jgi:ADP-ribose pyrophosphatase
MESYKKGIKNIYKGVMIDLDVEDVILPNERECKIEIVRHPGASAIVPMHEDGRVVMIKQYRYITGGHIWEIPAGKLNNNEDPLLCAERELGEEVGYHAINFKKLTTIWTTPGFSDERIHIFLATGLKRCPKNPDFDEIIEISERPIKEALDMIKKGEIIDAKSIIGLQLTYSLVK